METKSYDSLGLSWPLDIPTTVEEFDTLAKKPGAALAAAVAHIVFHSTLGDIRARFADVLEAEATKRNLALPEDQRVDLSRASGKKDADGEDVELNDGAYVLKVLANTKTKITDWAFLQGQVLNDQTLTAPDGTSTVVPGVRFDPSVSERKSGPPKLSKAALSTADSLIKDLGDAGITKLAKLLESSNPDAAKKPEYSEGGVPKREYLAKLISANEARKRREAESKLAGDYSALVS